MKMIHKKRSIEPPKKRGFNIPRIVVDGLEKGAERHMYKHPCAQEITKQNPQKDLTNKPD